MYKTGQNVYTECATNMPTTVHPLHEDTSE
jgi:hypothetical protein